MTGSVGPRTPYSVLKWLSAGAALVVVGDQWAKAWARTILDTQRLLPWPGWIELRLVENRGTAGGWGDGGLLRWLLVVGAAGLVVWLGSWGLRRSLSPLRALSLGALIGGISSNTIDRVFSGYVTDFISLYCGSWLGVGTLNPADLAIIVGLALWMPDAASHGRAMRPE